MKAFEEWLRKQSAVEDSSCTIPSKSRLISEEIWAEKGWRAALEWAKTQRSAGMEEDGSISVCDWVTIDRINEELNS